MLKLPSWPIIGQSSVVLDVEMLWGILILGAILWYWIYASREHQKSQEAAKERKAAWEVVQIREMVEMAAYRAGLDPRSVGGGTPYGHVPLSAVELAVREMASAVDAARKAGVDVEQIKATGVHGLITATDVAIAIEAMEEAEDAEFEAAEADRVSAERLAAATGIELDELDGTGFAGQVSLEDVASAITARSAAEQAGTEIPPWEELDPEDAALQALWDAEDAAAAGQEAEMDSE